MARRLQLHREFFQNRRGNLLVWASFNKDRTPWSWDIPGQGKALSTEFLDRHAYELGIQHVRQCEAEACDHYRIGDDFYTGLSPANWGSGFKYAIFTGGDVMFHEGTSYTSGPVVREWIDLNGLRFDLDNRWIRCVIDHWRGIEAAYQGGLMVTPIAGKSPLDLANGLRGNDLFYDLYDAPERVDALLDFCVSSTITLDKFLRGKFKLLAEAPNGVSGAAFQKRSLWLNGDPVDLISEEMGARFNQPPIEKLATYAEAIFFHHHSIGYARADSVSRIEGLSMQNIQQDPNGPRLQDHVDDRLIEASLRVPINLGINLAECPDIDRLLARLAEGRFALEIKTDTADEARVLVRKARRYFRA